MGAVQEKYFLAPSLIRFRQEINWRWPNRDRESDGWIGDASHQARKSDHNPDWNDPDDSGIVRAIDVDKDRIDVAEVLNAAIGHEAAQYVIHNGKIWSRTWGWTARAYHGVNSHAHHIHISIRHTHDADHFAGAWLTRAAAPKPSRDTKWRAPVLPRWYRRVIRKGMTGSDVKAVQLRLNKYGAKLVTDGDYGPKSVAAVERTQRNHNLTVDGIIGPRTAATIGG